MKITINSRVLKSALESANKAINPKPNIPTLANFLLEGDGSYLTITGSDGNTTIKETIPCETQGKALLPTNLLELVRTLPEGDVTIETEDTTAKVGWKNGQSTIPTFDPEDYPIIKDEEGLLTFSVKGETLSKALSRTIPHTADDELRPIMGGVLFNGKEGGVLDLVASDSHTLCVYPVKTDAQTTFDFVVPASALKLVVNAAKAGDVEIANGETYLRFRTGTTTIITRKLVGKFPNYESIFPKTFNSTLTADKASILSSIRRVQVCASKASGHLKFNFGMLENSIEAQDLSFGTSAREILEGVTYDGADLTIGFKGDFIARSISSLDGDKVKISFVDPRRAAVISSDDDEAVVIAMPIQI